MAPLDHHTGAFKTKTINITTFFILTPIIGSIIGLIKPISQLQISSKVFDAQNK